ncbi:MAG: hypothetical protein HY377_01960 [Candidatus Blackburnbacteria bacterium]|nr:hypothetical protein [Candidatus Blackburnbacteria bacterium]
MTSLLIKLVLVFLGVGAAAVFVTQKTGTNLKALGSLLPTEKKAGETPKNFDLGGTISNVLPAVDEIPSFTPLINTKDNIQNTVQSIINLPQEEKAAFCKQVCSQ